MVRRGILVLLLVAGCLVASPSADATVDNLTYRRVRVESGTQKYPFVKVKCPKKTRVIGGGVASDEFTDPIAASYPFDRKGKRGDRDKRPDDGWVGAINNFDGSPTAGIEVWAVCAKKSSHRYVSTVTPAPSGQTTHALVRCNDAAGEKVTGGGVVMSGPHHSSLDIMTTLGFDDPGPGPTDVDDDFDDGWQGQMFNNSGVTRSLKVFAICAVGRTFFYDDLTDPPLAGSGTIGAMLLSCPANHHITGGGITSTDPSFNIKQTNPVDDGVDADLDPDDSWVSHYQNFSSSPHQPTGLVICRAEV